MGAETSSPYSQGDYERFSGRLYQASFLEPCLLPDVGIDTSLLKFSGTDSNTVLNGYSNLLLNQVPGFAQRLGNSLGALTPVPNAVGLGALVLSIIMEICIKGISQTNDDSYGMLQRVFGEEKASRVRDTMSTYVSRHRMYMKNNILLQEVLRVQEDRLHDQLNSLRNSLLYDGQMSTRGFKIWVNGASFHIQMLIHNARLDIQAGKSAFVHIFAINSAISTHMQDLDRLLETYRTYKIRTTRVKFIVNCLPAGCFPNTCSLENDEKNCGKLTLLHYTYEPCHKQVIEHYVNLVFSSYEPIVSLKSHFSNVKNNLNYLVYQHDSFSPPSLG